MNYEEELNDENTIEALLIKVGNALYEIAVDEDIIYIVEPYTKAEDSKEQLTFKKALWFHDILLNYDTIKSVPVFDMMIPRDEFIDIIEFHNINK